LPDPFSSLLYLTSKSKPVRKCRTGACAKLLRRTRSACHSAHFQSRKPC